MSGSFALPPIALPPLTPISAQPIFQAGASSVDPNVTTAQAQVQLAAAQQQIAANAAQQAASAAAATAASNAQIAASLAAERAAAAKAAVIPLTGQSNSFAPGTAPGTVGSLNDNAAGTGLLSPAGEDNLSKISQPVTPPATPAPVEPTPLPPPQETAPPVISLAPTLDIPPALDFSNSAASLNVQPDTPPVQPPTVFGAAPIDQGPTLSVQAILDSKTSLTPDASGADPLNGFQPSSTVAVDQPVTGTVNPDIVSPPDNLFGALPIAPSADTATVASNGDTIIATSGSDTGAPLAFISLDNATFTSTNPNSGVITSDTLANPSPPIMSSTTDVLRTASASATIAASQVRASLGLLDPMSNAINIANAASRNSGPIGNVLSDVANQMGIGPAQGDTNQIAAFVQGAMVQSEGAPLPSGTTVGNDFQDLVAPVPQPISIDGGFTDPAATSGGTTNAQGNFHFGGHHNHHQGG